MAELFFFPLYAEKWLAGEATSLMDPAQEGAFIRLLCHAWITKDDVPCSLPADGVALKHLSRLGKRWEKLGKLVMAQFKPVPGHPTRVRNPMQWRVFQEQRGKHDARVEAGRKGGFAKASSQQNPSNASSPATARLQHLELDIEIESEELQKQMRRVGKAAANFRKLSKELDNNDTPQLVQLAKRFNALTEDGRLLKVVAEVAGALDGMHGSVRTWPELRTNIGDYLINPGVPATMAALRAYLYRDPDTARNGAKPTAGERAFKSAGNALRNET